jgi:hypothetical protein
MGQYTVVDKENVWNSAHYILVRICSIFMVFRLLKQQSTICVEHRNIKQRGDL